MDLNLKISVRSPQEQFNISIALSNTRSAAFQRANVYEKCASTKDKQPFVNAFRSKLCRLEGIYTDTIPESRHIEKIEAFAAELSDEFPDLLQGKRMRFGVAQKAVNLYLKFLWCLGYIPCEPPHCPVDGEVLKAVGSDIKWTKLDSVDEYKCIISKIREEAASKDQTIAVWELNLWNTSR